MSAENVQQALIKLFQDAFPVWIAEQRIAWENVAFKPVQGKPWMYFRYMPVDERIGTLGPGGYDTAEGMVQIDVNYPDGAGEAASRQTINDLRNCFRPQTVAYAQQGVTILSRSRAGGRSANGFYLIPFTVRWRAQITRP